MAPLPFCCPTSAGMARVRAVDRGRVCVSLWFIISAVISALKLFVCAVRRREPAEEVVEEPEAVPVRNARRGRRAPVPI